MNELHIESLVHVGVVWEAFSDSVQKSSYHENSDKR